MVSGSNAKPTSFWRSNAHWAAALFGYCLLTVALTWPLSWHLGDAIPGPYASDTREFVWSQWWWWHTLTTGLDPASISVIQHPKGMEFPLIYLMSQVFIVGLPLTALVGPAIAQNLLFLAAFPTAGLAAYALCLELDVDRRAAFLGGLIWAFFPNRMGHALAGHMFFLFTFSLPWMALTWVRLLRAPAWRRALEAGVVTALACTLHPLNIAYFVAPVIAALIVARLVGGLPDIAHGGHGRWVRSALLAMAVAALLVLPLAWPTLSAQSRGGLNYLTQGGATAYSVDLVALALPAPETPLPIPDDVRTLARRSTVAVFEDIGALGWLVVGLAAVGLWHRRRRSGLWAALALCGVVLALGPVLSIGGTIVTVDVEPGDATRVALPYAWVADLPVFGWSRTPARFLVLASLGLAVLAAEGLTALLRSRWLRPAGRAALTAALACGFTLAEYVIVWPFTIEPVEARPILRGLTGPVLNLPWGGNEGNLVMLYWQTQHEQPLVGGRMYRDLPGYRALYDGLRNLLLDPAAERDIVPVASDAERRAALAASGARTLLWDGALAGGPDRRDLLEQRLGPPSADDGRLAVFAVPTDPVAPGDLIWGLSTGWQPTEDWAGMPWRWIENRAAVILASGQTRRGSLLFSAQPGARARWVTVLVDGVPLTRFGVADWATYRTPEFELRTGLTQVEFVVEGDLDQTTLDPRCWRQSPVFGPWPAALACQIDDDRPRQFTIGFSEFSFMTMSDSAPQGWQVGEDLSVQTVSAPGAARANERIWIPLSLRAAREITTNLTVFVHVLDAAGALAAQSDAQPARSALPTLGWQAGDQVRYRIPLDLPAGLAPGTYDLRLGVYPTGDPRRLPIQGTDVRDDTIRIGSLEISP